MPISNFFKRSVKKEAKKADQNSSKVTQPDDARDFKCEEARGIKIEEDVETNKRDAEDGDGKASEEKLMNEIGTDEPNISSVIENTVGFIHQSHSSETTNSPSGDEAISTRKSKYGLNQSEDAGIDLIIEESAQIQTACQESVTASNGARQKFDDAHDVKSGSEVETDKKCADWEEETVDDTNTSIPELGDQSNEITDEYTQSKIKEATDLIDGLNKNEAERRNNEIENTSPTEIKNECDKTVVEERDVVKGDMDANLEEVHVELSKIEHINATINNDPTEDVSPAISSVLTADSKASEKDSCEDNQNVDTFPTNNPNEIVTDVIPKNETSNVLDNLEMLNHRAVNKETTYDPILSTVAGISTNGSGRQMTTDGRGEDQSFQKLTVTTECCESEKENVIVAQSCVVESSEGRILSIDHNDGDDRPDLNASIEMIPHDISQRDLPTSNGTSDEQFVAKEENESISQEVASNAPEISATNGDSNIQEADYKKSMSTSVQTVVKDLIDNVVDEVVKNLDDEQLFLKTDEQTINEEPSCVGDSSCSLLTDDECADEKPSPFQDKDSQNWKVGYLQVKLPTKSRKGKIKAWHKRFVVIQSDEFTSDNKTPSLMLSVYQSESGNSRRHSAMFWRSISSKAAVVYRTMSKTHPYAFTVADGIEPMLHLATDTESLTQEWMMAIRNILWPPNPVLQLEKVLNGNQFEISVIDNDFSYRAGLLGAYGYLTVASRKLILCHPQSGHVIQEWYLNTVDKFRILQQAKEEDANRVLLMKTSSDSSTGCGEMKLYCNEALDFLKSVASTIHKVLQYHAKQNNACYKKELNELSDWLTPQPSPMVTRLVESEDYYKVPPRQVRSLLDIPNFIFDMPNQTIVVNKAASNDNVSSAEQSTPKLKPSTTCVSNFSQDSGISMGMAPDDFLNCSLTSFTIGDKNIRTKERSSSGSQSSDSYSPPLTPKIQKRKTLTEETVMEG